MNTAALDLNDTGLILARGGKLEPPSPGYALFNGRDIVVGDAARRTARLEPLNVDNRFWHELDDRPLTQPGAAGRSRADLAFAHLRQLWTDLRAGAKEEDIDILVCSAPATYRPNQLGLIFGIARAAGIPLGGFMDAAVLAASVSGARGRFVYVDIHLHQAIATAVEIGTEARRERCEVIPAAGLARLQETWMSLIARSFVQRTRFDPLHRAATEQAVFDALPAFLEELHTRGEAGVQVPFGSDRHRISVSREEFLLESQPLYDRILMSAHRLRRAGHPLTIALSAQAAALPGLAERFAEFRETNVVAVVPGCCALAATAHATKLRATEDSATLFRALELLEGPIAERLMPVQLHTANEAVRKRRAPTHVLYRGKAHALGAQPLIAGIDANRAQLRIEGAAAGISPLHCSLLRRGEEAEIIDFSRHGTWLNEERVAGRAPLHAGDTLRIGTPGVTLELIAIDEAGA